MRIGKLETLLSRIQKNAASLASARAISPPLEEQANAELVDDVAALRIMPEVAPIASLSNDVEAAHSAELEDDFVSLPPEALESVVPPPGDVEFPEPELEEGERRSYTETLGGIGVSLGFAPGPPEEAPYASEADVDRFTPPPESGPQISSVPLASSEDLTSRDDGAPLGVAPTLEQLGQTVQLDASSNERLELGAPMTPPVPEPSDEFEQQLPEMGYQGQYDASLAPPPEARSELEEHDRQQRDLEARRSVVPAALRTLTPPSQGRIGRADTEILRPGVNSAVNAATMTARSATRQATFVEKLDRSLEL